MFSKGKGGEIWGVLITSNPSFLIPLKWRDLKREYSIEMFDQVNYQIYLYHINKIINYENANYSPSFYLILKTSK